MLLYFFLPPRFEPACANALAATDLVLAVVRSLLNRLDAFFATLGLVFLSVISHLSFSTTTLYNTTPHSAVEPVGYTNRRATPLSQNSI